MPTLDPLPTTATIDELVRAVNAAYQAAPTYHPELRPWRDCAVASLHSITKLSRRRYAARELAATLASTLTELLSALVLAEAAAQPAPTTPSEDGARRPTSLPLAPLALTIPTQVVQVRSPIQQAALRSIGSLGLGRAWRIAEHLIAAGLTTSRRSADNAIGDLVRSGLLADYQERGRVIRWAGAPGGTRRLVALTTAGQQFYRAACAAEPVESEIITAARQHTSVAHGIAILEARDLLTAAGYQIDADPAPILADPAAPLGTRSHPDLVLIGADGARWPVEVQREVHARRLPKLAKALDLGGGRLILILFTEAKRAQQMTILETARHQLPAGLILLTSLAALPAPGWTWHELRTG